MSSTMDTNTNTNTSTNISSYSTSYTSTKVSRRDQNGNLVASSTSSRVYRDSSLPPPIRKSKLSSESPSLLAASHQQQQQQHQQHQHQHQQSVGSTPRKHVSISQSDLVKPVPSPYSPDSSKQQQLQQQQQQQQYRIYINHDFVPVMDRQQGQRHSYRPVSRQSHLMPASTPQHQHQQHPRGQQYDENLAYSQHYLASQRQNQQPLSPELYSSSNYHRNLHQGQTLPAKKSPHSNYAFHLPPQAPPSSYNRYGSRSSSASYDRFGHHHALDRAYPAQTTQAIPDMVRAGERQQLDYERQTPRKIILSEGNLLTAHIEKIREEGRDNPFKPGTELSWEADLMVRLYKKGHPLSQVPELLNKIKRQLDVENSAKSATELDYVGRSSINQLDEPMLMVNRSKTIGDDMFSAPNQRLSIRRQKSGTLPASTTGISGETYIWTTPTLTPATPIVVGGGGAASTNPKLEALEDEVIDRIISRLDGPNNEPVKHDATTENVMNANREQGAPNGQMGAKSKLPPAIVNMPNSNSKKEQKQNKKLTETVGTKTKQSASSKWPDSSTGTKKSKSEQSKSNQKKLANSNANNNGNMEDGEPSSGDGRQIDKKRHRCCSIQ